MNRFWIILAVVIAALIGLFVVTKPDSTENGSSSNIQGDPASIQSDDHVLGKKNSKVVMIEYLDFQCPSCGAYYPIVKDVEADYKDKVAFVVRHYPIIQIHPNAFSAARAAEAAGDQGKFFEMHDKLYETQQAWGQVTSNQQQLFEGYAEELGLNLDQFRKDYSSEATSERINRDVKTGKQMGVEGTPTFFINGEKIKTPADKAGFEKLLDQALKNSK